MELKRETPGCVLLMQVGAFMKVLDEDARTVSAITGLKLPIFGSVEPPVGLGGVPKSGLDMARLEQDIADATLLGVRKTPTFFVNGRALPSFGLAQLQALVASEVAIKY